jgi:hypothetical protein
LAHAIKSGELAAKGALGFATGTSTAIGIVSFCAALRLISQSRKLAELSRIITADDRGLQAQQKNFGGMIDISECKFLISSLSIKVRRHIEIVCNFLK